MTMPVQHSSIHDHRARRCAARGHTLVEVTLATFVMSLIFVGLQSAVLIAVRAADESHVPISAASEGLRAIDVLAADLAGATAVSQMNAAAIIFTTPDRTGDGVADTIGYGWSGVAGAPLVRTVNGSPADLTAAGLRSFRLDFGTTSVALPATFTASAEALLGSYDTTSSTADWPVKNDKSIGQYFKPALPAGAASWAVTRAQVKARVHSGTSGESRVQIRNATAAGKPTTVLDEKPLLESTLTGSYAWKEFAFTRAAGISPTAGVCLIVQWVGDGDACDVLYRSSSPAGPGNVVVSEDGCETWSSKTSEDMMFKIYGTYSTRDPASYRKTLGTVSVTLGVSDAKAPLLRTVVRVANGPEVMTP